MKEQLETEVRGRFARLARAPHEEQKLLVGAASAKSLGYDANEVDSQPSSVTESFAGVGSPLALVALGRTQVMGLTFEL